MSTSVDIAFVHQFETNVLHLAQQKKSRLRNRVRVRPKVVGKATHFERLASGAMFKRTSRHQDTQLGNLAHTRRRLSLDDFERGELVDEEDDIRLLIDPDNEYAMALSKAAGRQFDDLIITAALGNATAVAADDTESTVALPAAQKIDVAAAGLTLTKLNTARELLDAAEVDEEDRIIVVSAKQVTDVLGDSTMSSADYNTVRIIMSGKVEVLFGFAWVRSERLKTDGSGDRQVIAYQKNAIGLGIGKDINTSFDKRPDKSNAMQVLVKLTAQATRIEEVGVVEIACNEP